MALLSPLIATWHDTDATAYQEDPFALLLPSTRKRTTLYPIV